MASSLSFDSDGTQVEDFEKSPFLGGSSKSGQNDDEVAIPRKRKQVVWVALALSVLFGLIFIGGLLKLRIVVTDSEGHPLFVPSCKLVALASIVDLSSSLHRSSSQDRDVHIPPNIHGCPIRRDECCMECHDAQYVSSIKTTDLSR